MQFHDEARHKKPTMTSTETTVVIATRDRPGPLADCLASLSSQGCPPAEIIISDGSTGDATERLVALRRARSPSRLRYLRCRRRGAAVQRNEAIDVARGRILFFLDDDVVCEPSFVEEIVKVFAADSRGEIGGVSGTVVNQTFVEPSRVNRWFMHWMAGSRRGEYGGRLIGPAWNHLPPDAGDAIREVDWAPSCCVAYRADVLRQIRFNEAFGEYAYAEDVHLSARVALEKRVVNTGRARLYHHDMGLRSHGNPRALGRAQVVNRWVIMRDVLARTGVADRLKLAMLQVYFGYAEVRACMRGDSWRRMFAAWRGRAEGLGVVWRDRSTGSSS